MSSSKLRSAFVVLMVGLLLGLAVFAASRLFVRSILSADARATAQELARRLGAGEEIGTKSTLSTIVRYVYFGPNGEEIARVSMSGAAEPAAAAGDASAVARLVALGRTIVAAPPLVPSLLGLAELSATEAAAPVTRNGATSGAVYAQLDQSSALAALSRTVTVLGMVAVGLAVLAVVMVAYAVNPGAGFGSGKRRSGAQNLPRDPLTGLPTRRGFNAALSDAVARATDGDQQVGLIIVDLDGVRSINDVWGHAAGDEVLSAAADRLRAFEGKRGGLARIAGGDFALIVESEANAHSLRPLAGKIRAALAAPYRVGDSAVELSVRLGVALFPVNAEDANVLFRAADTALSQAVREPNGGIIFFDTEMEKRMRRRTELERDLRQALERDEFVVFYQPQVELASGRLRGHEALVRWERPGEGILSPRDFLPIAVETGLIRPLGDWVLRKACQDAASWLDAGTVAVNFCPAQFRIPDADRSIAAILAETGLPAERLEIEVPESLFLQHDPDVMATLSRIKALGVRIAMDDFGAGYSGLASLAKFPFDKVKIDRSFVTQVTEDADVAAIVASIVALGRSLSVDITAEGVETDDQVTMLRAAGCSVVQGFLFGGPRRGGSGEAVAAKSEPVAANG